MGIHNSRSFEDLKAFLQLSAVPRLVPLPYRAQHTPSLGAPETERTEFCCPRRDAKPLSLSAKLWHWLCRRTWLEMSRLRLSQPFNTPHETTISRKSSSSPKRLAGTPSSKPWPAGGGSSSFLFAPKPPIFPLLKAGASHLSALVVGCHLATAIFFFVTLAGF